MSQRTFAGGAIDARRGLGWLPDYPDLRDYTRESEAVEPLLARTGVAKATAKRSPKAAAKADLREWCSPIEDQGQIGSCTAHAGVGMLEYFERKLHGKHLDGSRRFLYKVTRALGELEGDSGAFLRTTIGAMVLFGVPPESHWPYSEAEFDDEPPPFCYAFAQNYQAVKYYRLDPPETERSDLLAAIKSHLASQLPAMFGFTVYDSIADAGDDGRIPFPAGGDNVAGGHAVMAVGYDDALEIPNRDGKSKGAILIRNSWSRSWGEDGYGWLPYDYVTEGLAEDWWVLIDSEWVDTGEFET
ncbi:MAG: cysteine protease [Solirubrobacterales bacterium]|nr:cysteine protease [Solirubrobacterales bacterium]